MDTTAIKQEINDNIKTNGVGAITGQVLNETLNDIVEAVTPKLYNESTSDERITIETNGTTTIYGGENVRLNTAGYFMHLSEEDGVKLGNHEVSIEIQKTVTVNDERVLTVSDLSFVSRILGVDRFWDNVQYTIGDLVLYQYVLYQFTADHLGAWNWSDVRETNLRELLNF